MTGAAPFELFVRRTTANTKGVSIRDLTGTELATMSCPASTAMRDEPPGTAHLSSLNCVAWHV